MCQPAIGGGAESAEVNAAAWAEFRPGRFHEKGGTLPAVQELVERFEALRFDWTEEATQVTSLQPTHGPW
jgi:hypothetical protein